ncbi:MAG: nucleoside hydrolase, partial [Nitrososphaerota archaeon]
PEAANIVFNSSVPITCVGLDVSTNPSVKIDKKRYEEIRRLGGKKAELASRIMRYQLERFGEVEVHDALAVAAALRPEIFQTVEMRVQILTHNDASRGATVAVKPKEGERGNARICTSVDGEKFFELLLSRISEPD